MGSYLSSPITEKHSHEGSSATLTYGLSHMQGWRKHMEDAHLAETAIPGIRGLFAVWDGHGGQEVSLFTQRHYAAALRATAAWKHSDWGKALVEVNHGLDVMLRDAGNARELKSLTADAMAKAAAGEPLEDDEDAGAVAGAGAVATSGAVEAAPEQTEEELRADVMRTMAQAKSGEGLSKVDTVGMLMKFLLLQKMKKSGSGDGTPPPAKNGESPEVLHTTAGCTSIVAIVTEDNKIWTANAGDSRAVMCRGGKALALSYDHKPTQKRELDRIQKAGGFVNEAGRINGNLNLSRSIGDLRYKNPAVPRAEQMITAEPDIRTFDLTDEDEFMVLACDGIWDCKTNQQVVDFVRERIARRMPLSKISEECMDDCVSPDPRRTGGLGGDNMTMVVVTFAGSRGASAAAGGDDSKAESK